MKDAIREFVERELLSGGASVANGDSLLADGMLDSMDVVRLVTFVETHTGRKVPPQDVTYENFQSIDHLAGYLGSRDDAAG